MSNVYVCVSVSFFFFFHRPHYATWRYDDALCLNAVSNAVCGRRL